MDANQLFKWIFLLFFVALLAIRLYFGLKVRKTGTSSWAVQDEAVEREGKCSLILRPLMFIALLVLVGVYVFCPKLPGWCFINIPDWLRWLGVGSGVVGLYFLIWVHQTLGRHWSTVVQLRTEHLLMTTGPYRWIRHPMYTALMFCFIGLSLISNLWILMVGVCLIMFFFYRITLIEEHMMVEQFGEQYNQYKQRTGRFLPRMFI